MEFGRFVWLQILLVFFCLCFSSIEGYKFYVGGKDGWVVNPSQSYSLWAEKNRFNINDTLHFKYKKGSDSVLVVNKDDYFSCNTQNPIQKLDGGDSDFTVDRSGPFYFISGQNGNCQKGQKLLVIVLAPRQPKPPVLPPPPTSPTAPGPGPTTPTSPTAPQKPYHPPAASPPQGPGLPPAGGPVSPSPSPVITTPPSASPGPGSSQPSPSPSTSMVPSPASGYTPTTSPPAPPPEGLAPTPSGVPGGPILAPSGGPAGPTQSGTVTSPPAPPPEGLAPTPAPSGQPAGPTSPGTASPPPGSQESTAPSNNGALHGVAAPSIVLVSLAVVLVSVALS
ncbi:early nodulin-like protein 2 isoform X2 [Malus sylvestris]|uniref:early nodulin-like protein 2 isoform X2 n=1 Tax=Malus sylvestris TaxID=3752 RepID=UPI0010AA87FD|nr:early nodulin-like protein 2 isoform X2 [Malus domestica]XP_050109833.1 early nodulin-like protein 2 isoform X2 [Malus sylvestris]